MIRRTLAFVFLAGALAAHASNVAFVADVRGAATIEGNGPVTFLHELAAGTRLLLGTGAVAAITFAASGTEYTVMGPGEFAITRTEVRADKGKVPAKRVVTSLSDPEVVTRVSKSATASVRMRSLAAVSAAANPLEYPVGTRVTTLRPTLRWKSAADPVTVRVRDDAGNEIWKATMLPGAAPAQAPKLSPATRYRWTIMTAKGQEYPEASFETLPTDISARVERSLAAAKTFSQRVMHALVLQEVGAEHEAREAWAVLARERPDLPALAALAR